MEPAGEEGLQDSPAIFLPSAWQNLPQLDLNLPQLANNELFPAADTIVQWCANNWLG